MSETTPGNWQPDPYGRFAQRYWDGANWTENVIDASGAQTTDAPVPSAGGTFGAATTGGSALPVPALVVAGIGVVLLLLSLFVLNWFDINDDLKTELQREVAAATPSELRDFERQTGVSIDDFIDGFKLSEVRDIADAQTSGDPEFLEEAYVDWGYLLAIAAAAFAVVALFVTNLRVPALIAAFVIALWHVGVSYSLGQDDLPPQFGGFLGGIGLAACGVALLISRPKTRQ